MTTVFSRTCQAIQKKNRKNEERDKIPMGAIFLWLKDDISSREIERIIGTRLRKSPVGTVYRRRKYLGSNIQWLEVSPAPGPKCKHDWVPWLVKDGTQMIKLKRCFACDSHKLDNPDTSS